MTKLRQAAIYLRISQDRENDGLAIERQEKDCERLVADRGWKLVRTYRDTVSAFDRSKKRPEYDRMLAATQSGEIDAIVCWDLDRLTRQPRQLEDWIEAAETGALAVVTANGEADLTTDGGRMYARMKAATARAEMERKSARQKARNEQDRSAGKPPSRQAFGYSRDGMSVDPVTGPVVRSLFDGLLAGEAISEMVRRLNDGGFRTTERVSRKGTVSGGGEWNRTNVLWMLKNPRYAAIRTLDVRDETGAHKVEIGPGTWPAIVPRELFNAVQRVLSDDNRKSNKGGTARQWIGGGLYRCGLCGSDMRTAYRAGGDRTYRCRASAHLTRSAEPIDALVLDTFAGELETRLEYLLNPDPDEAVRLTALREEASVLRHRKDGLAADYADGLLDGRQLKVATDKITGRLAEVERTLASAVTSNALSDLLTVANPGAYFLASPLGIQRAMIDTVCTVTLLPAGPGRRPFDPSTVKIDWR